MSAYLSGQRGVEYRDHEVLMRSVRLDIVGAEAERLRGLEAEARIIADVTDEEEKTIAHFSHRCHTSAEQGASDALPLQFGCYGDGTEAREVVHALAFADRNETVAGVAHDFAVQCGNMREQQRVIIAQKCNEVGFGLSSEGGGVDGVNDVNVGG